MNFAQNAGRFSKAKLASARVFFYFSGMALAFTLEQLCNVIDPIKIEGATTIPLSNIGALDSAKEGDLAFLGNEKYHAQVATCKASAILVPADYTGSSPAENQAYIFVEKPSYTLALICGQIEAALWKKPAAGTHPTAIIAPSAKIGKGVHIGAFCVVGEKTEIGDGSVIEAQTTIGDAVVIGENTHIESGVRIGRYTKIGSRVHILPNAVLGADGFGFIPVDGKIEKIPQIGNVVIEDDVEIGAGTCIDRARFSSTKIGKGTKIDNLVQIGHNCVIGKYCFICGQAGMAGSTTVGDYVTLAGQVGLSGHIKIGDKATIGAQCGVLSDVEAGATMLDSPAIPVGLAKKLMVLKMRLPDMYSRLKAIEKQLSDKN